MTIKEWLAKSTHLLEVSSIPTAKLDAEVLLAETLQKDRSWLHAHPDFELQRSDLLMLDEQIKRRTKHEPLAYIRGKSEFYGREFIVTPDTLQPRPETETMIDILKKISPLKVIDVGTGSGCIAITAKLELPISQVLACDISDKCIDIAAQNAKKLGAELTITQSDLLQDINVKNLKEATLCCNLPYIPTDFHINEAAKHEPDLALFGGKEGLDYYQQLFEQITSVPPQYKPTHILTESLPPQHDALADFAEVHDYLLESTSDLISHFVFSPH